MLIVLILVLYSDTFMVFAYPDKTRLDMIYFTKKIDIDKKVEKLAAYDPKVLGNYCTCW